MTVKIENMPDAPTWRAYALSYGFVGNELLTPMNRSNSLVGLDPGFWQQMPDFSCARARAGLERLRAYASAAAMVENGDEDPDVPGMLNASVEFAHLFIGPPKPVAAPWETANDPHNEKRVGYGFATVAMQGLLAEEGLELKGENRQFEDHLGIELLYLSALCEKAAAALDAEENDASIAIAGKVAWFIKAHPLGWIEMLRANVDAEVPDGYYSPLLEYVEGVLRAQVETLS